MIFAVLGNKVATESKELIDGESSNEVGGTNRPSPGSNALMSKLIAVTANDIPIAI